MSVCLSVCLSICPLPMLFFSRPFIGPQITWSDPGLLFVDTVLCTLWCVQAARQSLQWRVYMVHAYLSVCSVQCPVSFSHRAVYSVKYLLCSAHVFMTKSTCCCSKKANREVPLCVTEQNTHLNDTALNCIVCSIHCAVYSVQCPLCSANVIMKKITCCCSKKANIEVPLCGIEHTEHST